MEATKTMLYAAKAQFPANQIIEKTVANQCKITEINGTLTKINGNQRFGKSESDENISTIYEKTRTGIDAGSILAPFW